MTPAGIEPATFRFVAQHLKHCVTAVPQIYQVASHIPIIKPRMFVWSQFLLSKSNKTTQSGKTTLQTKNFSGYGYGRVKIAFAFWTSSFNRNVELYKQSVSDSSLVLAVPQRDVTCILQASSLYESLPFWKDGQTKRQRHSNTIISVCTN